MRLIIISSFIFLALLTCCILPYMMLLPLWLIILFKIVHYVSIAIFAFVFLGFILFFFIIRSSPHIFGK